MAAHATVAEVLHSARESGATRAEVTIERVDRSIDVRITSDAVPAGRFDLINIADRVGAVGGELRTAATGTAWVVTAVIPCAS
jgi:hypothetical protein